MKNFKRILASLLAILMTLSCIVVVSVVPAVAYTVSENESVYNASAAKTLPTPVDNVYTINTANELMAFADALNGGNSFAGKTIKLNADIVINAGSYPWANPVSWSGNGGSWGNRFAGNFDGQGHTISGLYNVNGNNAGLFGRADAGTEFKNLTIKNSYFESNGNDSGVQGLGALIGSLDAGSVDQTKTTKISNVHIESTTLYAPTGRTGVGGIVGATANFNNSTLIIENCSFDGTISAASSSCVGGIVGFMKRGMDLKIQKCSVDAAITCGNEAAGLVGRFESCYAMTISNCLVKGSITANVTCTGDGTKYRTGAIIGIIDLWSGVDAVVRISTVLAAINCNSHESLIATIRGDNNARTVAFELGKIVFDSDVQTAQGWIRRDNYPAPIASVNGSDAVHGTNWNLESQIGSSYFNVVGQTSAQLKGKQVFDSWTVVAGDYPTPPTVAVASVYIPGAAKTLPTPVDNVYTITTANEFMAFADTLNGGNSFAGKTIKLDCDIVINQGAYGTWGDSPIGWSGFGGGWGNRFAGNFDGQGHTISGIYNVKDNSAGLFGRAASGTEFKNVNIVNSYFESTTAAKGVGAVFGTLDANWGTVPTTISNVHVEATIVASNGATGVGGLVGETALFDNCRLFIDNCSFKGTITAPSSSDVGGIVGNMKAGKDLLIENCDVDATITCGNEAAGFVGKLAICNALISNSIAKGSITANSACTNNGSYYRTGAAIGFVKSDNKNVTVQISNVLLAVSCNSMEGLITTMQGSSGDYTVSYVLENIIYDSDVVGSPKGLIRRDNGNSLKAKVNNGNVKQSSNWNLEAQYQNNGDMIDFNITPKTSVELKGYKVFDFWTAVENNYPTPPTTFAPDFYSGTASSAYITDGDTITIYTAEQFYGFASATGSTNFAGKTVKLARDLILNRGDNSDWASSAPSYNWECSSSWSNRFAGTFDGQGHTISGVYSKIAKYTGLFQVVGTGCVIQNLNLVNSYFESTLEDRDVGALIGYLDCSGGDTGTYTIENISVDAIVKATRYAGGIIGADSGNDRTTTTNITNCTFTGTVFTPYARAGGIIGHLRSSKNISGCTVKATISAAGNNIGGIAGYVEGKADGDENLTISNCYVDVDLSGTESAGGLIGRAKTPKSITISNCMVESDIDVSTDASNTTSSGLIGYFETTGAATARSVSVSNTLISVRGEKVLAEVLSFYGDIGLTVTLRGVKYDYNRFNGKKERDIYSGSKDLLTADYTVETSNYMRVATTDLKGQSVFTGWTAVDGNYPVPSGAKSIDTLNTASFGNYGKPANILGYQIKTNGNGTYTIRLIASYTHALDGNYDVVGFQNVTVTLTNGATKNISSKDCSYAYASVIGGGKTYRAVDYLCDGLFCLTIENAPADVYSIEVTPYAKTSKEAAAQCGKAVSWKSGKDLSPGAPGSASTADLTVLTLNVYYDGDADPDGSGSKTKTDRKNAMGSQILAQNPDVVCIQEDAWKEDIDSMLTSNGYTAVRGRAISRSGWKNKYFGLSGDYKYFMYQTIYYKTSKFNLKASGQKSLSDSPDTQYSVFSGYSDDCRPRGFNYAKLEVKNTGKTFYVFNVHLENASPGKRLQEANKLLELVNSIAGSTPSIMCGDFNLISNSSDAEDKTAIANIKAVYDDSRVIADRTDSFGTFIDAQGDVFGVNGATAYSTTGDIIDYCFAKKGKFHVYSYSVISAKQNGIYTSDHLPVVVKLSFK